MSNLLNNIEQLKENFSAIDANFNWPSIKSFIEDVERDVIAQTIGDDSLLYFQNHLQDSTGVNGQVLKLLQRAVAYLAVLKWSQTAIFRLTDKALFVAKSSDGVIISDKKLRDLRTHCEETGFIYLDKAISLMEDNLTEFPQYSDSGIRQELIRGFIKTAKDFSIQRDIQNSRLTFLSIYQLMIDVQDSVLPQVMGAAYYELFKEKFLDGDLSLAEKKVLPLIKKAVAQLTIARACQQLPIKINSRGLFINRFNDTKEYDQQDPADAARTQFLSDDHQDKGERKLNELKQHLIKHAVELPGFIPDLRAGVNINSAESGLYLL